MEQTCKNLNSIKLCKTTKINSFKTLMLSLLFTTLVTGCGPGVQAVLPDDPTPEPNMSLNDTPPENSQVDTPDPLQENAPASFAQTEFNLTQKFQVPNYSSEQEQFVLNKYKYLDPEKTIRADLLKKLVLAFHYNSKITRNKNYITAIDFAKKSNEKRMYIIEIQSGKVSAYHVAHGKGSDSNHDGFAEKFSNTEGSNASSLGYYYINETYNGSNGLSIRLDGLSSTNSNARGRAVVIHGSDYVQNRNVIQGRSYGCPAVAREFVNTITPLIKNNSLMLALN